MEGFKKRLKTSLFVIIGVIIGFIITSLPSEADMSHGWNLILVNDDYKVPDDYEVNLVELDNGQKVDKKIYPYLTKMLNDMENVGIHAFVSSGHRTNSYQHKLLDEKIDAYKSEGYGSVKSFIAARCWVALPGHSEHHLGIAVDINNKSTTTSQEVYKWLSNNAYKYGFIKRYPGDKIEITNIHSEPWHYRYVGYEHAKYIYEHNLCLEEYIDILNNKA